MRKKMKFLNKLHIYGHAYFSMRNLEKLRDEIYTLCISMGFIEIILNMVMKIRPSVEVLSHNDVLVYTYISSLQTFTKSLYLAHINKQIKSKDNHK